MSNQGIENNGVAGTGSTSCEGVTPCMHRVPDPASAGRHKATDQTKERMKWDEIGVFSVTEQRLAGQARQIGTNEQLTEIEIEEISRNSGE